MNGIVSKLNTPILVAIVVAIVLLGFIRGIVRR